MFSIAYGFVESIHFPYLIPGVCDRCFHRVNLLNPTVSTNRSVRWLPITMWFLNFKTLTTEGSASLTTILTFVNQFH